MRVAATHNILAASGKRLVEQQSAPKLVPQALCERWVKDLSSRRLGRAELSVLARDLNFSMSPKTLPAAEFVAQVESCLSGSKLEADVADLVRAKVVATLTKKRKLEPNVMREEVAALEDLWKDKDIMVLLADKGRCMVVLDKSTYNSIIMDLLSDVETYEAIPKDPTLKIRGKVCSVIRAISSAGLLSKEAYFISYIASEAPPSLYGLNIVQ